MGILLGRISAFLAKRHAAAAVACAGAASNVARFSLLILLVATATVLLADAVSANPFVRFDFNLTLQDRSRNTVFMEVFDDRPLTRDNFLQYVNGGHYDESLIHRLSKNFVLQGGGYYPQFQTEPAPVNISLNPAARIDLDDNPATPNPTVNNEFANAPIRSNARGTVAMAKLGGNPNSATSEFFFNIINNGGTSPNGLDFANGGYTVFAQVVGDGMTLIDSINMLNVTNLNPDIDNNGTRDGGPFYLGPTDAVPFLGSNLVVLEDAEQVDYLGAGSTTHIPETSYGIVTRDMFIDTNATFTGTGPLAIGAGRRLGVRENMPLNRPIINYGTLAPGLQLGSLTVGSYQQLSTGELEIQIRQTTVDTEHDRLVVTNTAQLNGKLEVSLLNNFLPQPGDSFTVLTAASITGKFSTIVLPQLSPGLVWDVDTLPTAVTLSVVAADYNRDGIVNAADYTIWRNARGTSVPAYAIADGNGDTLIDAADFLVWKNNFGKIGGGTLGSGAISTSLANVPEPAGALLLSLAAGLLAVRRHRPS